MRAFPRKLSPTQPANAAAFFEACASGKADTLRSMLEKDPRLIQAAAPPPNEGFTGLHIAARAGRLKAVKILLKYGAGPNTREPGDNTYPLHWAAANRNLPVMRALLDAGGDPEGDGDAHTLGVIGWATYFHPHGGAPGAKPEAAALLVERGARHHIFSAICLGDLDLIHEVAKESAQALNRRMSRFEGGMTPLHFAMERRRYDILDLLLELGCSLKAKDASGHAAMDIAALKGDREAVKRLLAAGAELPVPLPRSRVLSGLNKLRNSVSKCVPMIQTPDVAGTLQWYSSIGFKEISRFSENGVVNFGMAAFGKAEIMFCCGEKKGKRDASVWLYTNRVRDLYELLKSRQTAATLSESAAQAGGIDFVEPLNDTFYGARQFGIRDPNGCTLYFIQILPRRKGRS